MGVTGFFFFFLVVVGILTRITLRLVNYCYPVRNQSSVSVLVSLNRDQIIILEVSLKVSTLVRGTSRLFFIRDCLSLLPWVLLCCVRIVNTVHMNPSPV